MPEEMDIVEEFLGLCREFTSARIPYAVCGGFAVGILGCPRATNDIDILIRREDIPRAEAAAGRVGFTLSAGIIPFDTGKPTAREVLRISKAKGEDLLTLDLLIVTPILEGVWQTRRHWELQGIAIGVVSREGLETMKRLAGRPIDLRDIENLRSLPP